MKVTVRRYIPLYQYNGGLVVYDLKTKKERWVSIENFMNLGLHKATCTIKRVIKTEGVEDGD